MIFANISVIPGLLLRWTRREMSAKRFYSIPVLLALSHLLLEVTAQQCSPSEQKREASILGMMLQGHIFKKITGATLGNVCLQECYRDVRCQSFNFVIYQEMCELNNRTKEARPEDFVPNSDRYYFRRDWGRGEFYATGEKKTNFIPRHDDISVDKLTCCSHDTYLLIWWFSVL